MLNNLTTIEDRVEAEAILFLEEGATIRSVANELGYSKSTVAYDLRYRLPQIRRFYLQEQVEKKLKTNKEEAPARGAIAQHNKFTKSKGQSECKSQVTM